VSTRKPEGFGPDWLAARLARLLPDVPQRRLLIACSGGLDSMALLHAAAALRRRGPASARWSVRALHVHHHLQPAADAAAALCRSECRRLALPLRTVHLRLGDLRGRSVEAVAREARYAAARAVLRRGEVLVTAHHDDDQLETLLLQLMRGAGLAGLAGMPERAPFGLGWHIRPLLGLSRAEVERWAGAQALRWVDDASNADPRFDRNYLRIEVVPRLRVRWPAAARVAARTAGHLAEAHDLLGDLGRRDLQQTAVGEAIELAALARLPPARQRNALRAWLATRGLRAPDAQRLERIRTELPRARTDATPVVSWGDGSVRRYRGLLYAVAELPAGLPPRLRWDRTRDSVLPLGSGLGRLRLIEHPQGSIALAKLPRMLEVTGRQGGERLRPEPHGPRRPLKDLLREAGVLPWWRDRLPVIRGAGRLVAVADLWSDAAFRAGPRTRRRARFEWLP
jgi:tRNA(Ile)-lysidine synthase